MTTLEPISTVPQHVSSVFDVMTTKREERREMLGRYLSRPMQDKHWADINRAENTFKAGGIMVLSWKSPHAPEWQKPTLAPVLTFDEYLSVLRSERGMLLTTDEARLWHGWKPDHSTAGPASPVAPKPLTRDAKLALEVENLTVREEAKHIVQEARTPAVPLELLSVADLLDAPAPEWWIDNILPKDAIVVVGGDGGVGKSATIVEMAARLSTGTPFLGEFETRKARVLYAVGEGITGYGSRFNAVSRAHGLDAEQVRLVSTGVSMTSEKSMEQIRAAVVAGQVDVVIFDTLSSLSTLESENDAAEVARVINAAKRVREANAGCTVIIVHHTNKASGTLRGSSVIRDNADVVWMLKGDPHSFTMSSRTSHGGKVKDGEPREIVGLQLVGAHGSVIVERSTVGEVNATAVRQRALLDAMVPDTNYSTQALHALAKGTTPDASETTIRRDIKALSDDGSLTKIGHGTYLLKQSFQ